MVVPILQQRLVVAAVKLRNPLLLLLQRKTHQVQRRRIMEKKLQLAPKIQIKQMVRLLRRMKNPDPAVCRASAKFYRTQKTPG